MVSNQARKVDVEDFETTTLDCSHEDRGGVSKRVVLKDEHFFHQFSSMFDFDLFPQLLLQLSVVYASDGLTSL